jgi:hypothetical protein
MDYKKLNEVLKNLETFRYDQKRLEKNIVKEINGDADRREEGLWFEIFKLDFEDDLYIQLEIRTDSYGDVQRIVGIQFVRPTEKVVKVFEKI